jgi:hypothetical protein
VMFRLLNVLTIDIGVFLNIFFLKSAFMACI